MLMKAFRPEREAARAVRKADEQQKGLITK
jgi:hypothetical protein